ncbi:uncharacterized protein LOC121236667 [Juglans microcarpa x Juglans regia]|uniref:uncharacterized protein LOC121236667 n=1 Tax=Juglans microcarpa x Juglans regia TaxID=2249226 RepID=UPI001B7F5955|nr:uncharacterized protein LOC121236667 [Juglans microcarpa x Juglans regia]
MWNSTLTCFEELSLQVLKPWKSSVNAKTIYRDELDKKASRKKPGKSCRDRSTVADSKVPLLPGDQDGKDSERRGGRHGSSSTSTHVDKKGVIRVKVRMTKEEAARLLSRCRDGGLLEFKDVATELVQIPKNRVRVVSLDTIGLDPVLKSIPEETDDEN